MTRNQPPSWLSRRAMLAHLAIIVWVPGCAVAAWWQVTVALSGDRLGWLYSVEWPVFALFGVVVWWNFIHDDPESVGARALKRAVQDEPAPASSAGLATSDPEDQQLAEYNAYLANLAQKGGEQTWRRR